MKTIYESHYCSLHVRISNRAALSLYKDVLNFEILKIENEYYADKEHAYDMAVFFNKETRNKILSKNKKELKDTEETKGEEPQPQESKSSHETTATSTETKQPE